MNTNDTSVRGKVMDAIRSGDVHMRPRWHFFLLSALGIVGALVMLCTLAYVVSLLVFFLRESGAWFLPAFGGRGWLDFLRSLPWLIILLLALFVLVLEILVRRYAFVYKKPLALSVTGIILIIVGGGFALSLTPLHYQLAMFARHGQLPPPFLDLYRPPFHMRSDDVYQGTIIAVNPHGFVMADRGESTTTIVLNPRTRLPFGADFAPGDMVVVIGDGMSSNTVEAFGIRELIPDEQNGN